MFAFFLEFSKNLLPFMKWCKEFTLLCVIPSVYSFLYLLSSNCVAALTSLQPYKIFVWMYDFLKNDPQRNLRTGRARECIFRVSGGTNIENLPCWHQPWWYLCGFHICTGLSKKTLDILLDLLKIEADDKKWWQSNYPTLGLDQ